MRSKRRVLIYSELQMIDLVKIWNTIKSYLFNRQEGIPINNFKHNNRNQVK